LPWRHGGLMSTIANLIDLYRDLAMTGRTPESVGSWNVEKTIKEAHELTFLDPLGISPWALLRHAFNQDVGNRSFTVTQLISGTEPPYVARARTLLMALEAPEFIEAAQDFSRSLAAAVEFYGVTDPDAAQIVSDPVESGLVRREALLSIHDLALHFFRVGPSSGARARFLDRIVEFADMTSLVDALRSLDGGPMVMLALIRDPKREENSFFAFGIRDGDTVAALTDSPTWTHPLQAEMTRKPGRRMEGRWVKNAFPYELVDEKLKVGRGIVSEGIVPYTDGYKAIVRLADLPAAQGLWVFMMLNLSLDRAREEARSNPALSVFGRDFAQALLSKGGQNLPATSQGGLGIEPLSPAETTPEAFADAYKGKVRSENLWMEERYRPFVDEAALEVVDPGDGKPLALPSPDGKVPATLPRHARALSPSFFGSPGELTRSRVYLARYNLADLLQREADAEFDRTKDEVLAWWRSSVTANLPRLIQAVREGGMQSLCFRKPEGGEEELETAFDLGYYPGEIMRLKDVDHAFNPWMLGRQSPTPHIISFGPSNGEQVDGIAHFGTYSETGRRGWRCFTGKGRAAKVAVFYPDSQYCLADLAGVKVEDLPDVLRHWTQESSYVGNSILGAVDPVNWRLKNPWRRVLFRVRLNMSASTYKKVMEGKIMGRVSEGDASLR